MSFYKKISLTTAIFLILQGIYTLICWHLGSLDLLVLPVVHCTDPTPYQAGISTILCGCILFSMGFQRSWVTKTFGCILLINLFFPTYYLIFQKDFGLSAAILSSLKSSPEQYKHMVRTEIFSFGVLALLGIFWRAKNRTATFSNFFLILSLLLFFIGSFLITSYLLPLKGSLEWQLHFPIQCISAINIWLLSIGLICTNVYWDRYFQIGITKAKALIVSIGFAFFSILVSIGLGFERSNLVSNIIQYEMGETQQLLREKLSFSVESLRYIGKILENKEAVQIDTWQQDLQEATTKDPSIVNFIWIDDHLQEKFNPSQLPWNTLSKKIQKLKTQTAFIAATSTSDQKTFLVIGIPMYRERSFRGVLLQIFDSQTYFETILSRDPDFFEIVSNGDHVLGTSSATSGPLSNAFKMANFFSYNEIKLKITGIPTINFVKKYTDNIYIYIILLGGFVIAISLGALLYQWQQSKINALALQNLETENSFTLTSANIGRWTLDIKSSVFELSPYTLYIYGKEKDQTSFAFEEFFASVLQEDRYNAREAFRKSLVSLTPLDTIFKVLWPDGSIHSILCKGRLIYDENRVPHHFTGISWDISELVQSNRFLSAIESISKILSMSENLSSSLSKIIHVLQECFHWEILVLWDFDNTNKSFQFKEAVTSSQVKAQDFIEFVETSHLNKPILSKNNLDALSLIAVENLQKEIGYPGAKEIKTAGIRGAIAFPIFSENDLTGVIEIFKSQPFSESITGQTSQFFITLGIALGEFIQRQKIHNHLLQMSAIIASSSAAILRTDPEGIIQIWNDGAEKIYGWSSEEMIGKNISNTFPRELLPQLKEILEELRKNKKPKYYEAERIRKDGTKIWLNITVSPILQKDQTLLGFSAICFDINDKKTIEQQFHETEKKFRDFVETTEEWIWETDAQANFTYSNPSVFRILGFSEQEILGKNMSFFVFEDQRKVVDEDLQNFIRRKRGWTSRVVPWKSKEGRRYFLESNAEPILDENNQFLGFRGADRDITERMNMEKTKEEFISMASHELRTPLTSIYASLALILEEKNIPQNVLELVEVAERNCKRLTNLLNDIMDIERIQLGKLVLTPVFLSLAKIVEEAITLTEQMAKQAQVQIEKKSPFPEVEVYTDPSRVIQVLLNLLSNAIKFSEPHSSIFVSIELQQDTVKVAVEDTGTGIPKFFYPRIFNKFAQADTGDQRSASGTGLGLNISKSIMELLGGTLDFISEEGKGSIFFFTLPIRKK